MTVVLSKEFNKDEYMKQLGTGTLLKREERPEASIVAAN
jgi:hypothetical protein